MSLWMFMTLILLSAQEQYFKNEAHGTPADDYMGRGVQVVVGHYNGNLPSEENKKKNLSKGMIKIFSQLVKQHDTKRPFCRSNQRQ